MKETPRWHKIADEGLPREKGFYVVREKGSGRITTQSFDPEVNKGVTPDRCYYDYWYDLPKISEE